MPEPNDYQVLSRFVRDHKDEQADLLIDAAKARRLAAAIEQCLKIGQSVADMARAHAGLPPYEATYEEIYGEPDPRGAP